MKLPLLELLLSYNNEKVVLYFKMTNPHYTLEQCQQFFRDLLAWMWLNRYRKTQNKATYMFGPLLSLDAIWHTFILHTRDYHDFCNHYFEGYFHHDMEALAEETVLSPIELEDFLEDSFSLLGEAWVDRNFSTLIH